MKVKELKIASFSDVHLGHPKTPTVEILRTLDTAFPNTPETGALDLIFIAGDFFDRLLMLPDPNVIEIRMWINRFLRICKKYDIVLRVLEGTPSHDWKQPSLFTHINELARIGADVEYKDTLCIECIERFGLTVLYIPDEWNVETDDTWLEVQQALREHNLERVDLVVMHGGMDYQLPSHVNVPTHDPERYRSIINYFVFIGHIHQHSVRDRVISAGSFNRLCHNEEEPKGHMRVTIRQNGQHDIVFVETVDAKIYRTIVCTGMPVDEALGYIDEVLCSVPDGSHIRIQAGKGETILLTLDTLSKKYPTLFFTPKLDKSTTVTNEALISLRNSYQPVTINSENIKGILMERIKERIEGRYLRKAEELIDECLRPSNK